MGCGVGGGHGSPPLMAGGGGGRQNCTLILGSEWGILIIPRNSPMHYVAVPGLPELWNRVSARQERGRGEPKTCTEGSVMNCSRSLGVHYRTSSQTNSELSEAHTFPRSAALPTWRRPHRGFWLRAIQTSFLGTLPCKLRVHNF